LIRTDVGATPEERPEILSHGFLHIPGLRVTKPPDRVGHSYYKYYTFVRPEKLRDGWSRDRIMRAINAEGIPCFSGSCSEIYLEKAFPENMRPSRRLDVARELGETSLMFLVHPTLSENDMLDTCRAAGKVFMAATAADRASVPTERALLSR
jgi:dTDP-4-amino-4,6-dideoxygalactose transaminase